MAGDSSRKRYIDRYNLMVGKEVDNDIASPNASIVPDKIVNDFIKVLNVNPSYQMALKLTESADMFFKSCKDLVELVEPNYREDLFYTLRLGYRLAGVQSKLVTLLVKAKAEYSYPNVALSMIDESEFNDYRAGNMLHKDTTLNDVISNIWKSEVKLMSPYRRRVEHAKDVELYVENKLVNGNIELFDTVVIIPKDISDTIPDKDVSKVLYDPNRGLVLGDTILRTVNGRFGVTRSDIDMRSAF